MLVFDTLSVVSAAILFILSIRRPIFILFLPCFFLYSLLPIIILLIGFCSYYGFREKDLIYLLTTVLILIATVVWGQLVLNLPSVLVLEKRLLLGIVMMASVSMLLSVKTLSDASPGILIPIFYIIFRFIQLYYLSFHLPSYVVKLFLTIFGAIGLFWAMEGLQWLRQYLWVIVSMVLAGISSPWAVWAVLGLLAEKINWRILQRVIRVVSLMMLFIGGMMWLR